MGTISLSSDGSSAQLASPYTVTYTPSGSSATGSRDPKLAKLYITSRGRLVATLSPTSSVAGSTGSATFSASNIPLTWLRDCDNCNFPGGTYSIRIEYVSPIDGYKTIYNIESGTVSVSGPTGCAGCTGETGGGETGGGETGGGFGPVDAGDPLPPQPAAPGDPCLPPVPVFPSPPVDTPCSSGGESGSAPGFASFN